MVGRQADEEPGMENMTLVLPDLRRPGFKPLRVTPPSYTDHNGQRSPDVARSQPIQYPHRPMAWHQATTHAGAWRLHGEEANPQRRVSRISPTPPPSDTTAEVHSGTRVFGAPLMPVVIPTPPASLDWPPLGKRWFRWSEVEKSFWPGRGVVIEAILGARIYGLPSSMFAPDVSLSVI